jgi:RNA polymerase sigma-70 factor, ECF subfamily
VRRRGTPQAFQSLVERHRSMVYRVAYQFAGNHHDAEDIAQEVFLKVLSLPGSVSPGRAVELLDVSDRHERLHRSSSPPRPGRGRAVRRGSRTEDAQHARGGPGPEERAYAGELGQVLQAEIARLPPGQRIVFVMRHHQG